MGTPHMGILYSPCPFPYGDSPYGNGERILATSKSRIEEYLPPNFGREIVIFPLSRDCDTLKALRIPIICSIARLPIIRSIALTLHRSHLGIALIPAHQCFHLGIISLPARWSLLALSHLHEYESLLKWNSPIGYVSQQRL